MFESGTVPFAQQPEHNIQLRKLLTMRTHPMLLLLLLLIVGTIQTAPLLDDNELNSHIDSKISSVSLQHATVEQSDSTNQPIADNALTPRNNLVVGKCSPPDERIYTDNTVIENGGPSTLNGTLEVRLC